MTKPTQSKRKTPAAPKPASPPKTASPPKSRSAPQDVSTSKSRSAPRAGSAKKTGAPTIRTTRVKRPAEPDSTAKRSRARTGAGALPHPQEVSNVEPVTDVERMPDQPFEEGARDAIDPDLRHRLIGEAAYHHYAERGYEDGYDLDDWLQAEAEVDHLLLNPSPD